MKYLLDTNVLIYFLNEKDRKAAQYISEGNSLISVLTRLELLSGATEKEKTQLFDFLKHLHAIPITDGIADLAAELMMSIPRLRKKYPDALIAATCLYHHLELVTANVRDFTGVPGLMITPFFCS